MNMKRKLMLINALMAVMLTASACSSGSTTDNKGTPPPAQQEGDKTEGTADVPADPFGKYDPPIEVSTVRIVNDTLKFAEGETIDDNVWTKLYMDELGVKVKNMWVVNNTGGQGAQKMNMTIMSGDLPDFIPVDATQLKQLVDAGKVMDLTEIYEKFAAPFTKDALNANGPGVLQSATFNGKLMAIPGSVTAISEAPLLWVRTDWLKKLNLPEPKTMEDVFKISEAFTKNDPDGNGKADSIGLVIHKNMMGSFAGLDGFFNGFHAYPGSWIKDASGKLVYGSIQPETREALLKLQEMYKAGEIDREFGVKDGGKAAEMATAGKAGMYYGPLWTPIWPIQANIDNDPNADWQAFPIVSIDDQPARPQIHLSISDYYAVNKNAKNPEALLKLLNMFPEKGYGKTAEPTKYFNVDGVEKFKYAPFQLFPSVPGIADRIDEALKTDDTSKLSPDEKSNYEMIKKYRAGDKSFWAYERIFTKGAGLDLNDKYAEQNLAMMDEFYGAPTKTAVEKGSTLSKMEIETFTKIIMGDKIENFDKFVEDWKRLGGDDWTNEVNEWASSK
ncbi:extracellular solute-binding protein [Paenibacillus sp. GCM10027626]|uniref:extracellular solute-binding protein n=1 Tax=Paenibacillus sp. GCM10027626 TaxID=3273411 RepID=UPI003639801C